MSTEVNSVDEKFKGHVRNSEETQDEHSAATAMRSTSIMDDFDLSSQRGSMVAPVKLIRKNGKWTTKEPEEHLPEDTKEDKNMVQLENGFKFACQFDGKFVPFAARTAGSFCIRVVNILYGYDNQKLGSLSWRHASPDEEQINAVIQSAYAVPEFRRQDESISEFSKRMKNSLGMMKGKARRAAALDQHNEKEEDDENDKDEEIIEVLQEIQDVEDPQTVDEDKDDDEYEKIIEELVEMNDNSS